MDRCNELCTKDATGTRALCEELTKHDRFIRFWLEGGLFGRTEQTNVKFHRPTASSIKTSKQGFLTRYALNFPAFF